MTEAVMPTYGRVDIAFERGEGAYLYDTEGQKFLDFATGLAVLCLGHGHPHLVSEIQRQAATLMHTSNLYRISGQERLAERLVANTFADTVFFCNSGAEANECAIKAARRYHHENGQPERFRVITFENCFHGRTLATIAATGQEKVLDGFGPKVDGFDQVPLGDIDALRAAIGDATAAILVEPIQAEGGVLPVSDQLMQEIRRICDDAGLLLMVDEVQTGMGRTGRLLAHEWSGVSPDIATLGKGIGGGFPVGACLATAEAAKGMVPGTHGSTYGGNPLAMAAGNAVLDVILADGFMEQVQYIGDVLLSRLEDLRRRNDSVIEEVRGKGLLVGIKCKVPNMDLVTAMRARNVLVPPAGDNVMRMLPPLNIEASHVDEAIAALEDVCRELGQ
ncbi:MAG: aspartate aminotransferase family protein [Alphaproteobacteria bacterium]|jgi:acetylornithine/N-succinyldiaminopimelate aminotransferase|nr:aspartate aminotransferase family protein [Alphaproteobacteria bacterium]MDP6567364.1 aspartate aminotransferase family protein [Alphaproteobacteria bacterium]MDP6813056.1 aspartate aminotransferase family protein [Alphaproteobacteria bacterium]